MNTTVSPEQTVILGNDVFDRIAPFKGEDLPSCICFLDEKRGWIGGAKGTVWNSFNGGYEWSPQKINTSATIVKITMDGKFGALVTDKDEVWLTEDQGISWHKAAVSDEYMRKVYVFQNHIWLACYSYTLTYPDKNQVPVEADAHLLYWDRNPANAWKNIPLNNFLYVVGMQVRDANNWLVCGDRMIVHTQDNGATLNLLGTAAPAGTSITTFEMLDYKIGYSVYSSGLLSNPAVQQTKDGCKTWRYQQELYDYDKYRLGFRDEKNGYIFCERYDSSTNTATLIWNTSNSGRKWTRLELSGFELQDLFCQKETGKAWFLFKDKKAPYVLIFKNQS